MSLQYILQISESVGVNDQRFIGQTKSRNLKITSTEILTIVPFEFTLSPHRYMEYNKTRNVLNALRVADKSTEQYLNFGANGWASYIAYQGNMAAGEIAASYWTTDSANKTLVLGNIPGTVNPTSYVVRQGDFCQVGRYAYIATADVLRGVGTTVSIPVHRNLLVPLAINTAAVIGQYGVTQQFPDGNFYQGVTFPVLMTEYPTYTMVPAPTGNFIQWSGSFKARENVL